MNKDLIVIITVIFFIIGMGTVAISLFSTVKMLPRLNNTTKTMGDLNNNPASHFQITRVYYQNTEVFDNTTNVTIDICESLLDKQFLITKVSYDYIKIPESCELFVNNKYQKKIEIKKPPCIDENCTKSNFELIIDIKPQNIYIKNEIKICCDELCLAKDIDQLCI